MSEITVTCPQCNTTFAVDRLIRQQVEKTVRDELDAEARDREAALSQREQSISQKERDLKARLDAYEKNFADEVKKMETLIREHVEQEFQSKFNSQIQELTDEMRRKDEQLKTALKNELELRKREREVQELAERQELEVRRKVSEEVAAIQEKIQKKLEEDHALKDAEKDQQIESMKQQLQDMQRKLEQGSERLQGEVFEVKLESVLSGAFPLDQIVPVPAGIRGADIKQVVCDSYGRECGTIIWELKRTKTWNEAWIGKLKEDLIAIRGDIGVIASVALPSDVSVFQSREGVWVTEPRAVVALASALRAGLIQVAYARTATQGLSEKSEAVYAYLTSEEFRQRVQAIVDAFKAMHRELDDEKRAVKNIWSRREKQIERAVSGIAGLYGSLQGIIGMALPTIPGLVLDPTDELPDAGRLGDGSSAEGSDGIADSSDEDLPF